MQLAAMMLLLGPIALRRKISLVLPTYKLVIIVSKYIVQYKNKSSRTHIIHKRLCVTKTPHRAPHNLYGFKHTPFLLNLYVFGPIFLDPVTMVPFLLK